MNKPVSRRRLISGAAAATILPFVTSIETRHAHAQTASTPYVVPVEWLAEQLERVDSNVLVLDLSDLRSYRDGHIPGAVHSWWLETVERDYPVFGTVLNQKAIDSDADDQGKRVDWFRRHGIGPDTHVVACDRNHGHRAARIVWFLRFLGHEQASVLDGGVAAWEAASRTTQKGDSARPAPSGEHAIVPADGYYLATNRLAELLEAGEVTLVDIRTDAERNDTVDGQFDLGIIPGSIHLPWNDQTFDLGQVGGAFDPSAARGALERAGILDTQRIVLYGRFGTDANQMWVVLKACGYPSVEIYDRGWVEWSESGRSSLPIT